MRCPAPSTASPRPLTASGHGRQDYLHLAPRSDEERTAQRKAARLSLDTSVHRGEDWKRLVAAVGETLGQDGVEVDASRWHKVRATQVEGDASR